MLSTEVATAQTMFRFLREHVEQETVLEPFYSIPNESIQYQITLEDGRCVEYITIIDSGQGRVSLEVGFNAVKLTELIESGHLIDTECMGFTKFEVSGYGKMDVFMSKKNDGSGNLQFSMGGYRQAPACAILDALLAWFPSILRRNIDNNTALAMALHPRLGVDSRLADLGDAFALVLKLL
jgi:hypothetical protein